MERSLSLPACGRSQVCLLCSLKYSDDQPLSPHLLFRVISVIITKAVRWKEGESETKKGTERARKRGRAGGREGVIAPVNAAHIQSKREDRSAALLVSSVDSIFPESPANPFRGIHLRPTPSGFTECLLLVSPLCFPIFPPLLILEHPSPKSSCLPANFSPRLHPTQPLPSPTTNPPPHPATTPPVIAATSLGSGGTLSALLHGARGVARKMVRCWSLVSAPLSLPGLELSLRVSSPPRLCHRDQ